MKHEIELNRTGLLLRFYFRHQQDVIQDGKMFFVWFHLLPSFFLLAVTSSSYFKKDDRFSFFFFLSFFFPRFKEITGKRVRIQNVLFPFILLYRRIVIKFQNSFHRVVFVLHNGVILQNHFKAITFFSHEFYFSLLVISV